MTVAVEYNGILDVAENDFFMFVSSSACQYLKFLYFFKLKFFMF